MKKLLSFVMMMVIAFSATAQISIGKMTRFPDAKYQGLIYKPEIAFCKEKSRESICIRYCSDSGFKDFGKDSQLVLDFSDSTTVMLRIENSPVNRYHDSVYVLGRKHDVYTTFSYYDIEDWIVKKIIRGKNPIVRIRLVFINGDFQDYAIQPRYQSALMQGLRESRSSAGNM